MVLNFIRETLCAPVVAPETITHTDKDISLIGTMKRRQSVAGAMDGVSVHPVVCQTLIGCRYPSAQVTSVFAADPSNRTPRTTGLKGIPQTLVEFKRWIDHGRLNPRQKE